MNAKREPRRRSGASLRPEDHALWRTFAEGIEQARFKPRVPEADTAAETLRALIDEQQRRSSGKADGAVAGKLRQPAPATRAAAAPTPPMVKSAPGTIDAKAVRRLGNGRLTVDARIDLHGMRQSEAHAALRNFLRRSAAKGHRMVLVITGKGSRRTSPTGDIAGADWFGDGLLEPGVLRRQVPLWLREAEFGALVVGFTTAHIRHGGDGALYVQLRRRA